MFGLASVYCEFEISENVCLTGGKLWYCVHVLKKCRERSSKGPSYWHYKVVSDELHS